MKTNILASLCALSLLSFAACGDDDDGGDGGDTGDGTDGAGADGAPDEPDAAEGTIDCNTYCADILADCTGDLGQYSDMADCTAACATFPAGTSGASSGDSLACRAFHLLMVDANPDLHCRHAGPGGNDGCGSNCEGFCDIVIASCTGDDEVFADEGACMAACGGWEDTGDYAIGAAGDNLSCRLFHATMAAADPGGHCGHTADNSSVCQ